VVHCERALECLRRSLKTSSYTAPEDQLMFGRFHRFHRLAQRCSALQVEGDSNRRGTDPDGHQERPCRFCDPDIALSGNLSAGITTEIYAIQFAGFGGNRVSRRE